MSTVRLRWIVPLALLAGALGSAGIAQQLRTLDDPAAIRYALAQAQAQGRAARARAEQYEGQAARAGQAVDRTARDAAGVAARIQQTQARIAEQQAQVRLIDSQRGQLRARLAERQQPLIRLTAALQRLSRRPPVLSLLRPGSVTNTMHMRAIFETMLPEVQRRTAALRAEIARGRALQVQAARVTRDLRASGAELRARRAILAALETSQRLTARAAGAVADREAERALAFAEQARDLDTLSGEVSRAGRLRTALAQLPGPVIRPARPEEAQVTAVILPEPKPVGLIGYIAPVAGALVSGFGDTRAGQLRSRGIALAPAAGAQVVAPAAGRVAFAGPYRGYDQIVIIEHQGGWTSLITGLAQLDTRIGDVLVGGSPLGLVGRDRPVVTLELRRNGELLNPLDYIRGF